MRQSKQALAFDPPTIIATAAWTNLGEAYTGYREYENAESAFRQAVQKDDENEVALASLAYVYYKMGRYAEAIQAADQALELDIGDADAWLIRGLALADRGDTNQAYISLSRANALKPQNIETMNKLTAILYERGEIENALSLADQVISLSPNDPNDWFYRAWVLLRFQQYNSAIEPFNRAVQLAPHNAYAWLGRGQLYEALGVTTDALQMYGQALLLRPGDPMIQEAQHRAYTNRLAEEESRWGST
jgi:tetratricopeptide (TPR) repeat protein